ncbi:MAG: hypothetical protein HYY92_02360 [Parcubacteria group bacterium]|nr:hypothetical protein [Parcubacteria group bacterium]
MRIKATPLKLTEEAIPGWKNTRIEIPGLQWRAIAIADRFVISVVGSHRPTPAQGANIMFSQKRYHAVATVLFAPRKQNRKLSIFFKKVRDGENSFRHWQAQNLVFTNGDTSPQEYGVTEYPKGPLVFSQPSPGPGRAAKAILA